MKKNIISSKAERGIRSLYVSVILALFFFVSTPAFPSKDSLPSTITARITDVYDGDTARLADNRNVRYLGIDTPETHEKTGDRWIDKAEPYALDAMKLNKKLVVGRTVSLVFDKERQDRHGRLLCYVFVDDLFVNEKMIREGLAFPYIKNPNIKYKDRLKKAFIDAYRNRKNLYSVVFDQRTLSKQMGKTGWYRGKISTVVSGTRENIIIADTVWLNFKPGAFRKSILKEGNYIYAYGKLNRSKDRYVITVEKPSHFFIE